MKRTTAQRVIEELALRFRFRWNQWRCKHNHVERLVPDNVYLCRNCGKEWK